MILLLCTRIWGWGMLIFHARFQLPGIYCWLSGMWQICLVCWIIIIILVSSVGGRERKATYNGSNWGCAFAYFTFDGRQAKQDEGPWINCHHRNNPMTNRLHYNVELSLSVALGSICRLNDDALFTSSQTLLSSLHHRPSECESLSVHKSDEVERKLFNLHFTDNWR